MRVGRRGMGPCGLRIDMESIVVEVGLLSTVSEGCGCVVCHGFCGTEAWLYQARVMVDKGAVVVEEENDSHGFHHVRPVSSWLLVSSGSNLRLPCSITEPWLLLLLLWRVLGFGVVDGCIK